MASGPGGPTELATTPASVNGRVRKIITCRDRKAPALARGRRAPAGSAHASGDQAGKRQQRRQRPGRPGGVLRSPDGRWRLPWRGGLGRWAVGWPLPRGPGSPGLSQVRWSRYGPDYLEPEVDKEVYRKSGQELSEEEKMEQDLKALQPIKAAPSNVTSSVFSDPTVSKFINMMMKGGNKVLARSIMSQTLEAIKRNQVEKYHQASEEERESIECNPYIIFHQALKNCQPIIGISNIKKGGKTYQVPTPLTDNRKRFLAMKWLITECREHKHYRIFMHEKLSQELLQAFNNEGPVIKRKHDMHKMAEANRAYAHYRWW